MKFLIIIPKFAPARGLVYTFPLGLAYISASLKKAGYEVHCLNLNHTNTPTYEAIRTAVERSGADVICSGGISPDYMLIKNVFDIAREVKPAAVRVIGGGVLSSEPELVLLGTNTNIGVIGEGEEAIIDIAEALGEGRPMEDIKGIVYNDEGVAKRTVERPAIANLDTVPWPDLEGLDFEFLLSATRPSDFIWGTFLDTPRLLHISSTRSCPFGCTFCYHPNGKKYRERSLDNFFGELEDSINKYDINMITVIDELFAVKQERVEEFCERIKNYDVLWNAQLRVDIVNEDLLGMMNAAGCISIGYGIESMSDDVLRSMRKKTNPKLIKNALKLTYDAKLDVQGSLIFGDCAETKKSADLSLKWWAENRKYSIMLGSIRLFPGSPMWHSAVERGVIKDPLEFIEKGCPLANATGMPDEEFQALNDKVCDFYNIIVYPALIKLTVLQNKVDSLRGYLYQVTTVCPHCAEENVYANIPVGESPWIHVLWSCRKCKGRFDVFYLPQYDDALLARLEDARGLLELGRFTVAIESLEHIIEKHPNCAEAYHAKGRAHEGAGDTKEALNSYRDAAYQNPLNPKLLTSYANAIRATGDNDTADIFINQAERIRQITKKLTGAVDGKLYGDSFSKQEGEQGRATLAPVRNRNFFTKAGLAIREKLFQN